MTKAAGLSGAVPQVSDSPYRGPDQSINQIVLSKSTSGECAPMQAVKQPVTLESFDHREALKMILLSHELWPIISGTLLI